MLAPKIESSGTPEARVRQKWFEMCW